MDKHKKKLKLKFISPTKLIKEQEADFIVIPAIDGDIGILPEHTPFLANIREGIVKIKDKNRLNGKPRTTEKKFTERTRSLSF